MDNPRLPKNGDIWYLPELEDEHDMNENPELWLIVAVFKDVFVYDAFEVEGWTSKSKLWVTPEPPKITRAYRSGWGEEPTMPHVAILLWRDREPRPNSDHTLLSIPRLANSILKAAVFVQLQDPKITSEAKFWLEQILKELREQNPEAGQGR